MEKTLNDYVHIWNSRETSTLSKICKTEAKYWDTTQEGNAIETLTGAIHSTHEAFPNVHLEVVSLSAADDTHFFLEWRLKGTNTGHFMGANPTNQPVEITGLDSIKLEQNKIIEIKSFYDTGLLMNQLGM